MTSFASIEQETQLKTGVQEKEAFESRSDAEASVVEAKEDPPATRASEHGCVGDLS